MPENTTNGASTNSLGGLLDNILSTGTEIYTAKTNATAANKTANASIMQSIADVAKSKYTLIAVGVVVVGGVLWAVFRRKN